MFLCQECLPRFIKRLCDQVLPSYRNVRDIFVFFFFNRTLSTNNTVRVTSLAFILTRWTEDYPTPSPSSTPLPQDPPGLSQSTNHPLPSPSSGWMKPRQRVVWPAAESATCGCPVLGTARRAGHNQTRRDNSHDSAHKGTQLVLNMASLVFGISLFWCCAPVVVLGQDFDGDGKSKP